MPKFYFPIIFFFKTVCLFCLISGLACTSLYYHPSKQEYFSPEKLGFYSKNIFLTAKDGIRLHLWQITDQHKSSKEPKGVILQFHGNGENMTTHFISLVWLVNQGYELYTYDYRGYGLSGGEPDPESIYEDSLIVLDYAHAYAKSINKKLIVYGQSLGGAIALRSIPDMKAKENLGLVVADGTFFSYRSVAKQIANKTLFPPIGFLLAPFFSDVASPEEYIPKIAPVPLLVIHGTNDPVVPFDNGKEVFRLASDPKIFWEIRGGGHVDWMQLGRSDGAKDFLKLLNGYFEASK